MGDARLGNVEADLDHRLFEFEPVLALFDGLRVRADELDAPAFQRAVAHEFHRGVERRLATQGGQKGVGPLGFDDAFDHFGRDRLDVGARGELRVGHDGGRVGVHQHYFIPLLGQRLAGLHAGIVKFAALADDNRAGADEEDLFEVGILRHRVKNVPGIKPGARAFINPLLRESHGWPVREPAKGARPTRWRCSNGRPGLASSAEGGCGW